MSNKPIESRFLVVRVEENVFDVVVFGSMPVLKAFHDIYHGILVEESSFDKAPICVMPNFETLEYAEAWRQYWIKAFSDPEKACKTCATVNEMFRLIAAYAEQQK